MNSRLVVSALLVAASFSSPALANTGPLADALLRVFLLWCGIPALIIGIAGALLARLGYWRSLGLLVAVILLEVIGNALFTHSGLRLDAFGWGLMFSFYAAFVHALVFVVARVGRRIFPGATASQKRGVSRVVDLVHQGMSRIRSHSMAAAIVVLSGCLLLATYSSRVLSGGGSNATLSSTERKTLVTRNPNNYRFPSEAAESLARDIGRDERLDGYRAILAANDVGLLRRAVGAARDNRGHERELSRPLEDLIVEHYGSPLMRAALLGLVGPNIEAGERVPRYHTRALFDLLYADLKMGIESSSIASDIIATDQPGIEGPLLEVLPQLGAAASNELVMFFGERRYAPATAALVALYATPYEEETNGLLDHISQALLRIGTPEAREAVMARLQQLKTSTHKRAPAEISVLLRSLAGTPASNLPWARVRAALPDQLTREQQTGFANLVMARKETAAAKELVRCCIVLGGRDAAQALLALGGPDEWRAALVELRKAPPDDVYAGVVRIQIEMLEQAIADPAKEMAATQAREREASYQALLKPQRARFDKLRKLRESEPERYVAELEAWITSMEALNAQYPDVQAARGQVTAVADWRRSLIAHIRTVLKQPDRAIALTAKGARAASRPVDVFAAELLIADIYRFDKRDAKQAVAHYRAASQALESAKLAPGTLGLDVPMTQNWLAAEIAYLETGKTLKGEISRKDLAGMGGGIMFFMGTPDATVSEALSRHDAAALGPALEALPPSLFNLQYAQAALALPPKAAVKFLVRNDPSGYLSTALLAQLSLYAGTRASEGFSDAPDPAKVKAVTVAYFDSRQIRLALASDARFASPEKTWALFRAAARKADRAAMRECYSQAGLEQADGMISGLPEEALKRFGEALGDLSPGSAYGEFREMWVSRMVDGKRMVSSVTFVNDAGEWKIDGM